jgi:hypothetical protein
MGPFANIRKGALCFLFATRTYPKMIEKTRISCTQALDRIACAPFFKERRIRFTESIELHRKSGEGGTLCAGTWQLEMEKTGVLFWIIRRSPATI